jgi:hypothetical protein
MIANHRAGSSGSCHQGCDRLTNLRIAQSTGRLHQIIDLRYKCDARLHPRQRPAATRSLISAAAVAKIKPGAKETPRGNSLGRIPDTQWKDCNVHAIDHASDRRPALPKPAGAQVAAAKSDRLLSGVIGGKITGRLEQPLDGCARRLAIALG